MIRTFLYTTEINGVPTTLKLVSEAPRPTEFLVTVLTAPELQPFKIKHEDGSWNVECKDIPAIKALEESLIEAVRNIPQQNHPVY